MINKLWILIVLMGVYGQTQAAESDKTAQSAKPKTDGEMTAEVKDIMRTAYGEPHRELTHVQW